MSGALEPGVRAVPRVRWTGTWSALAPGDRRRMLDRTAATDEHLRARVAEILARVRREGDAALRALARDLDGVTLDRLEVPRARIERARDALEPAVRRALERSHANLVATHRAQLPMPIEVEPEPGVRVGRRAEPVARAGLYAPGGRAAYPSSVLMAAVPARVAGVGEIVLCSPPRASGEPAEVVLAAAALAGVDRVFALGGSGAIAAMAYGTESVPRADRIVGPGNRWVAEAKRQVAGDVPIDAPEGPSELLVIADAGADPDAVARELVAQAEHDPDACAVAIAVGEATAEAIERALVAAVARAPRRGVVEQALAAHGAVLAARSLAEALDVAAAYAPEHLLLAVASPEEALPRVRHAGAVFLGPSSSVVFGDYLSGANHALPTGGAAARWSGLSTLDFVRWTSYQRIAPEAAARLAADTATLAEAEGLPGHAEAARAWRRP